MNRQCRPVVIAAGLVVMLLVGFLFSCSDNPADVTENSEAMTGTGDIDPQTGRDMLLAHVNPGSDYRGGLEVWAMNLTVESDSVVSFELVLVNKTDRDIFPPIHFVITRIVPHTVTVLNPDGFLLDGLPYYDFSGQLGDDGVLTPDEGSGRVETRFGWPEPMAFSIGFRLLIGERPLEGVIGGVVFEDRNQNGQYDRDIERGVAGVPVELRSSSGGSPDGRIVYTDRSGHYGFGDLAAAVYEVRALGMPGMAFTTPNPILVTLVELPDGTVGSFLDAHFGSIPLIAPIETVFGPVPVGPASHYGTRVDTFFVVGYTRLPVNYFLRVEPPMIMGPWPMYIDQAKIRIDSETVFRFECPPDSLCFPPVVRTILEPPGISQGEHTFSAEVFGNEGSMLFISIEREVLREDAPD